MQVGITAEFLGTRSCGPATYTRNLLRGLGQLAGDHEYSVYVATRQALPLVPPAANLSARVVGPYTSWIRIPVTLPLELLVHPVDLLHAQGWAPPWSPCPVVATIHDLAWEHYPETYTKAMRRRLSFLVRATARRSRRIITSSQNTARDLMRLYHVPAEKIRVIYPALDPDLSPVLDPQDLARVRARYHLAGPYILYLGVIEPKKNVATLIQAYAKLRRDQGIAHQLVIAGRAGWLARPILELAASTGLDRDIVIPGEIPDHDVRALYGGADVFAYLSSYEGFGYPPLEAMACGTPVLAANTSSLPEVLADAALLVDPSEPEQVARELARLLTEGDLRNRLRSQGLDNVKRFEPVTAARQVVGVYEECLSEARYPGRQALSQAAGRSGSSPLSH